MSKIPQSGLQLQSMVTSSGQLQLTLREVAVAPA